MQNIVPTIIPELLTLSENALQGATVYGADIGLLQNIAANIRVDRHGLLISRDLYEQARAALFSRRERVRSMTETSREALRMARDILKANLGSEYSEKWDITGLVGSLIIPRDADGTQAVLESFKSFFVANPSLEVAALNVTAARFASLLDDLVRAQAAVATQVAEVVNLLASRDQKVTRMRKRLRALIAELDLLIGELDRRWLGFGFNRPGAEETPEAPENVRIKFVQKAAEITRSELEWEAAPRSKYYRMWKRVIGVDSELICVGNSRDTNFMFDELPSAASIEIAVSAVNDGGESEQSAIVTLMTN